MIKTRTFCLGIEYAVATLLGDMIREVDLNGLYYNENNIFGNREIHSTRIARIKLSCIILLNFFRLSKISRLFSVFHFYLKGDYDCMPVALNREIFFLGTNEIIL